MNKKFILPVVLALFLVMSTVSVAAYQYNPYSGGYNYNSQVTRDSSYTRSYTSSSTSSSTFSRQFAPTYSRTSYRYPSYDRYDGNRGYGYAVPTYRVAWGSRPGYYNYGYVPTYNSYGYSRTSNYYGGGNSYAITTYSRF